MTGSSRYSRNSAGQSVVVAVALPLQNRSPLHRRDTNGRQKADRRIIRNLREDEGMEHVTNIAHLLDAADWAGTRGELVAAATEYVNDTDEQTVIVQPNGDVVANPSAMADAQRVSWDRVLESVTA